MTKDELSLAVKKNNTPMLELMLASIIHKAVVMGDQTRLDFILNRLIGKVKEQLEITMPKATVIKRLNGEEIVLGIEKPVGGSK